MNENNFEKQNIEDPESNEGSAGRLFKKPTVKEASILFSVVLIIFMLLSNVFLRLPLGDYYIKAISSEILLVMVPPIIFLLYKKYDIRKILRLNKISFVNIILIVCITGFSIPVVGILNLANMVIIKLIFGSTNLPQVQIPDIVTLIKGFIVIGMSAAICEEVLFRGVIMRGYEKLGKTKAIIITAFLFGLMHHDFQRFLGTFLLGILMGFLVYRADSLYAGMVAHFTNNSLVVLLSYGLGKLTSKMGGTPGGTGSDADQSLSMLLSMPKIQLITTLGIFGVMFLCFLAALAGLLYAFMRNTTVPVDNGFETREENKVKGLLWVIPGVMVIVLIYLLQGISLAGVENEFLSNIIKILGL
ncbi:type II CAAX endopeptidase family protein [Pseudobacteroides cellulosolvens]|uniref:Abortive infection protein n=1 Tax=Pseudobacteroides cellulosolvens ATCC 35603 = DSM 2933 TaxID=398512 RepID=A0A0L6JVT5_9FIRM|nr:type II CAAX endopeptidase family protein [Pseudobacteroides cellulosolvens]KNY29829.1 Abortive infection protein [Pseudobacteroides cellulosolvens ATCC 35603 = DSM 2933]